MYTDDCEAQRDYFGKIRYFIGETRVTRNEFHQYRAEHGYTGLRDTEFSLPVTHNVETVGHWKSMVGRMTEEFLSALGGCQPYDFDEKTSFHICHMELKEKFMTVEQINYLYSRSKERQYQKTVCSKGQFYSCEGCFQSAEDLRCCIDIDEILKSDKEYAEYMDAELRRKSREG